MTTPPNCATRPRPNSPDTRHNSTRSGAAITGGSAIAKKAGVGTDCCGRRRPRCIHCWRGTPRTCPGSRRDCAPSMRPIVRPIAMARAVFSMTPLGATGHVDTAAVVACRRLDMQARLDPARMTEYADDWRRVIDGARDVSHPAARGRDGSSERARGGVTPGATRWKRCAATYPRRSTGWPGVGRWRTRWRCCRMRRVSCAPPLTASSTSTIWPRCGCTTASRRWRPETPSAKYPRPHRFRAPRRRRCPRSPPVARLDVARRVRCRHRGPDTAAVVTGFAP